MKNGIDSGMRQSLNAEVDLFETIQSHALGSVRLNKYMDGKSTERMDPMVICCDNKCDLGQWIHGSGIKKFYTDSDFHKLRADHARFHVLASKVVRHGPGKRA